MVQVLRPIEEVHVHSSLDDDKIEEYVLSELKCKLIYGHSQAEIEHHLKNAASFLCPSIPTKWSDIKKLLKKLSYSNPKHYKICCQGDHSSLLKGDDLACAICKCPCNKCIDYYVLGLSFDDWFLTQERCKDLLNHWQSKDEWFNVDPDDDISLIELWHGSRFRELSHFWDSSKETLLPAHCTHCNAVVPADIISSAEKCENG